MKIYLTEIEAKNIKIPKGRMLNANINYKKRAKPRFVRNVNEVRKTYCCGKRWVFIEHSDFIRIETLENLIRDIDFYFENPKSRLQREYIGTWKID